MRILASPTQWAVRHFERAHEDVAELRLAFTVPGTLIGLLVILAACAGSEPPPPLREVSPMFAAVGADAAMSGVAHLSGGDEIPSVTTEAAGKAVFRLSQDGTRMSYRLIVTRIEGVFQAHLHYAPPGARGPLVAFLFEPVPGGTGPVHGVLAEGSIAASDLAGPLAGATLEDLADEISAGNIYVHVHTLDHPPGEVRGQVQ